MDTYFYYKDEKGKVQRHVYCSHCHAGPFKQSDIGRIVEKYSDHPEVYYCTECRKELLPKSFIRGTKV